MIDINLVNTPVQFENFTILNSSKYPALFLGFIIKNSYDDNRINLNLDYSPLNVLHFNKSRTNCTPLKGILLKPNTNLQNLIKTISIQEKLKLNLVVYENILSQYGLACKETYSYFEEGIYPIDFNNLKDICNDPFNNDKKIFQHLLQLDEKTFEFQKFSSLKLFVLTN